MDNHAVPVPEPHAPSGGTVRYSVPQAARILGISERAIRKRIDAGTLFAVRDGRAWSVFIEEPESGTGTADTAVPPEPTEPRAVPRSEPESDHAVPGGTGTAVDIAPLVALVADLAQKNAALTESSTFWQIRARQLEEQVKQLTATVPDTGETATMPLVASPVAPGEELPVSMSPSTSQPAPPRGLLRRILRRSS